MPITPANFCLYSSQDESKRKPIIDEVVLEDYLTEMGFRCMYDDCDRLSDIRLVRICDNVIRNTNTNELYHFLRREIGKTHRLWLKCLKSYRNLLYQSSIIQMQRLEPNLLRDTSTTSYIPFLNGIVCVTKAGYSIKPYSEVLVGSLCLLSDKIIKRNFEPNSLDFTSGEWYKFCRNAAGEDGIRFLMRMIGYTLHTYKDKSKSKIVVFADAANSENKNAMGGTGKTLIANDCMREIRSLHWEDGKEFNTRGTFKFQGLNSTHEVICLDDVKPDFDPQVLYNKGTGNFSSEEKFKQRKTIDHKLSPKTIVTTNYGLLLRGDSDKRRFLIFGFTGHYSRAHTPSDEFGHQFFEDWTGILSEQYQYFYLFAIECIRMYLALGVVDYRYDEVHRKALGEEFDDVLLDRIEELRDSFVGLENAMQIKDWLRLIGTDDYNVSDSIKKYMDSEGYELFTIRQRIQNAKNPSKLYYFDKR